MSTVFINNHYRTKLKLGRYGQIASYIPIVAFPGVLSMLFHKAFVQPSMILRKDQCLVCVQTRAATLQNVMALGLPLLLAPLAAFMVRCCRFFHELQFAMVLLISVRYTPLHLPHTVNHRTAQRRVQAVPEIHPPNYDEAIDFLPRQHLGRILGLLPRNGCCPYGQLQVASNRE
jgi:Transmembrane protein 126